MDLSKLSDADLLALKSGDLTKVTNEGLMALKGIEPPPPQTEAEKRSELIRRELTAFASPLRGAKDVIDTGAEALSRLFAGPEEYQRIKQENARAKEQFAQDTSGSMVAPVGRVAGQIAGTAPVVGGVGNLVSSVAPRVGAAISGGGFSASPLPLNVLGGATSGALTAGLIDPESAATGMAVGGGLPIVGAALSPLMNWGSRWLMQSAIKPTIKELKSGDAKTAVDALLDKGISPTKGGVEKLRALVSDKNDEIASMIRGSPATVNKFAVTKPLGETAADFSRQVNPTADLAAISNAGQEFLNSQATRIPVQEAQKLKTGTYKILAKKYGQVGTADTEAQKALARGLKDEIAAAVPSVKALNEQEATLIKTLNVAERRALMELNKNPMGLSLLANSPATWAAFMADRSSAFKAIIARMMYSTNQLGAQAAPVAGRGAGLLAVQED